MCVSTTIFVLFIIWYVNNSPYFIYDFPLIYLTMNQMFQFWSGISLKMISDVVMPQFDWLCDVCGCVMSPTSGIYWVELGFINNCKEPQLWLVLFRYSADVASAFPWVVTDVDWDKTLNKIIREIQFSIIFLRLNTNFLLSL